MRTWTTFMCYIWSDLHFLQSWCNFKFGVPYFTGLFQCPGRSLGILYSSFCTGFLFTVLIMYWYESWSIKNAEHQRTDAQTVVLEKTPESPLDSKEINQWILKEINPEYSLEGLILKLKIQYFVHPLRRANTLVKILMLEKIEGKRRRGQQKMKWFTWLAQRTSVRANSGR